MQWHTCCTMFSCKRREPFARGRFCESAIGNAANPYASLEVRTVGGFFWLMETRKAHTNAIRGGDDEACYRIAAKRKLEGIAGVFFVFRYRIHRLGDVRAAGAVHLQAVVAIAYSGRVLGRGTRAQRLDRAGDTRQPVSVRERPAARAARHCD